MGMFSWNCEACGFSLRDCSGCSEDSWMGTAVVLTPDDSRVIGHYDGYGRVGESFDMGETDGKFTVYHKACWVLAGKPEYTVTSKDARDQGFCHPMHGQPFPLPTKEWVALAKGWHGFDRFLERYKRFLAKRAEAKTQARYDALAPDRQRVLCEQFQAERKASKDAHRARFMDEYYEGEHVEPALYVFDGVSFDYSWLSILIDYDKARSWNFRKDSPASAVLEP